MAAAVMRCDQPPESPTERRQPVMMDRIAAEIAGRQRRSDVGPQASHILPGSRVVTSWRSQLLPSGSLKEAYER
jgi:hypothetical protein